MQLSDELRAHFGFDKYDKEYEPMYVESKLAPLLLKLNFTHAEIVYLIVSYAEPLKIQRVTFSKSIYNAKIFSFNAQFPSDYRFKFITKRDFFLIDMRDSVVEINSAADCVNNCNKLCDSENKYDGWIFRYNMNNRLHNIQDRINCNIDAIVGFKTTCAPNNYMHISDLIMQTPFYDMNCKCAHHRDRDNTCASDWVFANCAHPIPIHAALYSDIVFPIGLIDVAIFKTIHHAFLFAHHSDAINNIICSDGLLYKMRLYI